LRSSTSPPVITLRWYSTVAPFGGLKRRISGVFVDQRSDLAKLILRVVTHMASTIETSLFLSPS